MEEERNNAKKQQENEDHRKGLPSVSLSKASLVQSRRASRARNPDNDEEEEPLNVALNYGLEEDHDNRQTARVHLMKHPQDRKDRIPIVIHPDTPVTTAKTKPLSSARSTDLIIPRNSTHKLSDDVKSRVPGAKQPAPIIAVPLEKEYEIKVHKSSVMLGENKRENIKADTGANTREMKVTSLDRPTRLRDNNSSLIFTNAGQVNEGNNTDISYQPRKMFATKATNTSGSMTSPASTPTIQLPVDVKPYTSTVAPGVFTMDDCLEFAISMVKSAGAFALQSNRTKGPITYTTKDNPGDLKTHTNNEVEQIMVTAILGKYPNHK